MVDLPYDMLETIAGFADIDTRRHMGFSPRRLPRIMFDWLDRFISNRRDHQCTSTGNRVISTVFLLGSNKLLHINYSYARAVYTIKVLEGVTTCFSIRLSDNHNIFFFGATTAYLVSVSNPFCPERHAAIRSTHPHLVCSVTGANANSFLHLLSD